MPPAALATDHVASRTPASSAFPYSSANAGRLISTVPKPNPTGTAANASVRTPLERSAPSAPCERACLSGRHARDGGRVTNSSVPASEQPALSTSAAAGEATATTSAAMSGPDVKSSSSATESSANAAPVRSSRPRSSTGHSARSAPPTLGIATPPTSPHRTSATVGAPPSVSPSSAPVAATSSTAAGSRMRRCPTRSISRLCSGAPNAAPSPNAPSTSPATA